jgi:hypothetical protein
MCVMEGRCKITRNNRFTCSMARCTIPVDATSSAIAGEFSFAMQLLMVSVKLCSEDTLEMAVLSPRIAKSYDYSSATL